APAGQPVLPVVRAGAPRRSPAEIPAQVFEAGLQCLLRGGVGAAVVEAAAVDGLRHLAAVLAGNGDELQQVLRLVAEVDRPGGAVLDEPELAVVAGPTIRRR